MKTNLKKTLLLVEDDYNVAQVEKLALEKLGYYIILAQTGESAVNLVNTLTGIDLVLMDIILGKGIDGTEAAKQILDKHDMPLIFLTSHVDSDIVLKTEEITSYGYVIKGSGIMVLDASIKMAFKLFDSKQKEKEKEIALKEREQRYKSISEITSDFVFSCLESKTGEFKIDWMAGAVEKITGYTIAELKKRGCWKFLVHPDDTRVFDENILKLPKEASSNCTLRIRSKNDSLKWLSINTTNLTSKDAISSSHVFGGCRDITESKQAEEMLRRSKLKYDKLVSKIPIGLYMLRSHPDGAYSLEYISPNIIEMLSAGEESTPVDKQNIFHIIHPDDLDGFIKLNEKQIREILPFDWIGRTIINGNVRWMRISSSPEPQENGDTLWYGIVVDITENVQNEEAIKKSEVLLKSSIECQKETILFSIDKNYRYLYFNKAHRDAMKFAYNKDVAKGMNILECITSDDDRAAAKENYDRALSGESHSNVRVYGNVERAWYESFFNPILNENNEIIGATGMARNISDRKNAEEALRESEKNYHLLFKNLNVGFALHKIILNENGKPCDYRFLEVNPAFEQITGLRAANLVGKTVMEVLPDTEPFWIETYGQVALTGKPISLDNYAKPLEKHYQVNAYSPAPGKFATLVIDITERKQTEIALRESEERYAQLADSKKIISWEVDSEGLYTFVSPVCKKVLGYEPDELIGRFHFYDLHPEAGREDFKKSALQVFQQKEAFRDLLNAAQTKTGKIVWFSTNGFPILNPDGTLYCYRGSDTDVTEQRQAEEELKKSREAFRNYFEMGSIGMCVTSPEKGWVEVNDRLCKMLGYSKDELKTLTWAELTHPDDLDSDVKLFEQVLSGKRDSYQLDKRFIRKDGSILYTTLSLTCERNSDGSVNRNLASLLDISERKQVETIQKIQHNITSAMVQVNNLEDLCETIRKELSALFDTSNFFIALYDPETDTLSTPFDTDEKDNIPVWKAANSMSGLVIQRKKSLLMNYDDVSKLAESGKIELIGARSQSWLGVPLEHEGRVLGVMVVQSYTDKNAYNQNCVDIMETISNQLTIYIEHTQAEAALIERENQIVTFLNATADLAYLKDDKFIHLVANQALCDFFGKSEKEVLGKTDFELMPEHAAQRCRETDEQTVNQKTFNISEEIVGNRYYETRKFPVDIEDGKTGVGAYIRDITERKQAENSLRQSEERYRSLFNEAPFIIWDVDFSKTKVYLDGLEQKGITDSEAYFNKYPDELMYCLSTMKLLDINDSTLSFYGAPDLEYLRQNFSLIFTEDSLQAFKRAMVNLADNKLLFEGEVSQRTFSGEIRNVFIRVFLPESESGTFSRIIVVMIDITERLKAQEQVRLSEQRFREIWDKSFDGMRVLNNEGRIVMVNSAFCAQIGKTKNEVEGEFIDVMYDSAEGKKYRDKAVERMKNQLIEPHLVRQIKLWDGRLIWFELSNSIIDSGSGERYLLSIFRDITERKQAEENLNSERNLLRTLIDTLPESVHIYIKDRNSRYVINNLAHLRSLGAKSQEEVTGKTSFDFFPFEQAQKFFNDEQTLMQTGNPLMNVEELVVDKVYGGAPRWHLTTKVPLHDSFGNITGLVGLSSDITERRKSEEEIIRANEELKKINSQKDKFFSIIAHDLRSPFQGFLGLSEIMAEDTDSLTLEELIEFSRKINKSANVLYDLLGNLLEWAQMQRGNITFSPKELNLAKIASFTIDTLLSGATQKEITVETQIPESLKIYADEKMINSVIRNLLSNALKFTPRGGKVIIIAEEIDSGAIEVTVRDNGVGMSEEYKSKLFKLDEKVGTEGTEGEASTGLGLLLCKEFVEKNDGTIRVESELGKGSAFRFTIPSVPGN